jgi:hypothetical protein
MEDYDAWVANYGHSLSGSGAGAAAVPEPASATLILVGASLAMLLALVVSKRRLAIDLVKPSSPK